MKKIKSQNLLYEIGVEEIPSEYIESARQSIKQQAAILSMYGYGFDSFDVYVTPRRIVIFAINFFKQELAPEERFGPSKEQSYQNGSATSALIGFLKSSGKKESEVEWKETPKGTRALVHVRREVKPLRHFFETLPFQIEFPKLMRWEKTNQKFVRPIRWTFALIGSAVQNYTIGDVKSGNFTYGHRFLANRKIRVTNADIIQYQKLLKKNHVILNLEERVSIIKTFLKKTNNQDEELIRRVANLVEEPFAIEGSFKKEYLSLPSEVLATCMKKHQKTFACYDSKGKLENRFAAIINGKRPDTKIIARNYENVLISRLEDAKFFYQEDIKTQLETKVNKLKELIFLGKLGSYLDKVARTRKLIEHMVAEVKVWPASHSYHFENIKKDADRTAVLCKADLMSHLVYEFPELQGIAGAEYAKREGENEWVSRAIREHYYPLNLSQSYTELEKMSPPAVLVSIADRIDLLVGAIGMGIEVSGSKDPYALRRATGGIVRLIHVIPISFSFDRLVHTALQFYGSLLKADSGEILKKIKNVLEDRMIFELDLKQGTRQHEIFKAVFRTSSDDIAGVYERFNALLEISEKNTDDFVKACKVVERTSNILKGVKNIQDNIDTSQFEGDLEKKLHELLSSKSSAIRNLSEEKKYNAATKEFSNSFYGPVHDFFEKVMVNVPDEKVRANRQALMKKINRLYTEKIADLALITNK